MIEDELEPDAKALVDLARGARSPSDEQRERAYQTLMAGLAGGSTLGASKALAAKSGGAQLAGKSAFVWLKWAVPATLVALLGAGAYVWHSERAVPVVAPRIVAPPPLAPIPSAAPLAITPSGDSERPAVPSAGPGVSAAPALKSPSSAKPSADDLVQELTLLHQALAESRSGHAARALELARQHAQRYPSSRLRIERDAIEVRSLCALGRAEGARKIADRLRAQAPNSPVSAALAETCVGK